MRVIIGGKVIIIEKEILLPVFLLLFTILYFCDSHNLSNQALALPKVLGVVIVLCSLISIIKTIKVSEPGETSVVVKKPLFNKRVVLFLVLFILFISLIPLIGFTVAVSLFLIGVMLALDVKNTIPLVFIPVFVLSLVYFVFAYWLKINFPTGALW